MQQPSAQPITGEARGRASWISRPRLEAALVTIISLIGIGIRLHAYFQFRSLWNDEANVAMNLMRSSFLGLLSPLDYDEVAPVGFLLLEKAMTILFGNFDYVLRILPQLAGMAAVPLTYVVARRLVSGPAALLALLLMALSPTQRHFTSELKQFAPDVLAALVLVLLGANLLVHGPSWRRMLWLAATGIVLTWISHPAVFVLGGVLLAAGIHLLQQRDRAGLLQLGAAAAVVLIMLAVQYSVALYHSADNTRLLSYWGWAFAPLLSRDAPAWLLSALIGIYADPLELPFNVITVGLAALGIGAVAIRRWHFLVLLLAPLLLALAASSLKLYPFTGRFLLFAAPLLFMVICEGVALLGSAISRISRPGAALAAAACVVYMAYPFAVSALEEIRHPILRDHIKPVMAYLQKNRQQGDVIYVYYFAQTQYAYYAPFYGLDGIETVKGVNARTEPRRYLDDIEKLEGSPRVWFLFSHNYRAGIVDEQAFYLKRLDKIGVRLARYEAPGAALFLYDLSMSAQGSVHGTGALVASPVTP